MKSNGRDSFTFWPLEAVISSPLAKRYASTVSAARGGGKSLAADEGPEGGGIAFVHHTQVDPLGAGFCLLRVEDDAPERRHALGKQGVTHVADHFPGPVCHQHDPAIGEMGETSQIALLRGVVAEKGEVDRRVEDFDAFALDEFALRQARAHGDGVIPAAAAVDAAPDEDVSKGRLGGDPINRMAALRRHVAHDGFGPLALDDGEREVDPEPAKGHGDGFALVGEQGPD